MMIWVGVGGLYLGLYHYISGGEEGHHDNLCRGWGRGSHLGVERVVDNLLAAHPVILPNKQ